MKENGKFIISLDFELLWGMRDKITSNTYEENILGVRESIPKMLKLFEEFEINATFSIVGFLFAKNKDEILEFSPDIKPSYFDKNLSPYNGYLNEIGDNENVDKLHYASSMIEEIKRHPNHEISTHTFSHYYCLEEGQNIEDFKRDLVSAIKIANKYDIVLESIIFPRNQYNKDYLSVCNELGINSFRGNEKVWFNRAENGENESLMKRVFRFSDSYINISGHHTYTIDDIRKSIPYNIPSSRFLRPFNPKLKVLEKLKLQRIKNSMTAAAKNREIYHLWWHPHNHGAFQQENFSILRQVLLHYSELKSKFNFESLTMNDLANKLNKNNE